jgi:hypothetical protein
VRKLQSAALLLDFWLGQGERAAAIPAAVLPMLCIALRAFGRLSPFARLSRPSNAGQAKKTRNPMGESKKGHLARVARSVKARWRGCSLACALPYGLSYSRAALSNFFTGSKVSNRLASFQRVLESLPSDMLLHWRTLLDGPAMLSYRSPLGRPSSPAGKASRKSLAHPSRGCTNHAKIVMEIPGLDPSLK